MAAGDRSNVDLLAELEVAGASVLGVTIMRTHIRFTTAFANATAAGGLTYGLLVDRKLDVGRNVGPNPISEHELDWMLLDKYFPNNSGGLTQATANDVVTIDNRSKRKMQELSQAYLFSILLSGTTDSATPRIWARTLVALP